MSDEAPSIPTRVAHFGYGDTQFCGYSVRNDLVDQSGYWNSISLAIGGPRLTSAQECVMDGLATASLNADPRIWPLKATRLLSSYGSAHMGIGASFIFLDGGFVGAPAIEGAARLLVEIDALERAHGAEALAEILRDRIARGGRLMGFGVPNRDEDERVLGARVFVDRYALHTGRFWKLMLAIEQVAVAEKPNLRLNIGAASSAVFLDMGFTPGQVGILATLMLLNNMVANASEAAEQQSALLREFPRGLVRYVGPADRVSPRAQSRT